MRYQTTPDKNTRFVLTEKPETPRRIVDDLSISTQSAVVYNLQFEQQKLHFFSIVRWKRQKQLKKWCL